MPQIFIEYKPLVGEDAFIKHWHHCRASHMKDGLMLNSELYKIREGMFLGMIDFNPNHREEILTLYTDHRKDQSGMQTICKSIPFNYAALRK